MLWCANRVQPKSKGALFFNSHSYQADGWVQCACFLTAFWIISYLLGEGEVMVWHGKSTSLHFLWRKKPTPPEMQKTCVPLLSSHYWKLRRPARKTWSCCPKLLSQPFLFFISNICFKEILPPCHLLSEKVRWVSLPLLPPARWWCESFTVPEAYLEMCTCLLMLCEALL